MNYLKLHILFLYLICSLTFILGKYISIFAIYDLQLIIFATKFFFGFIFSFIILFAFKLSFLNDNLNESESEFKVQKIKFILPGFLFFISCLFELIATNLLDISYLSLLYNLMPLVTFLLEKKYYKNDFNFKKEYMLLVGIFISIFSIIYSFLGFSFNFKINFKIILGIFFCFIAIFSSCFCWIIKGDIFIKLKKKSTVLNSLFISSCVDMSIGLICSIILLFFTVLFKAISIFNLKNSIFFVLKESFFSALISYVFFNLYYMWALSKINSLDLSFYGTITPFLVSILAVVFLRENIDYVSFLIGATGCSLGIFIYSKNKKLDYQ